MAETIFEHMLNAAIKRATDAMVGLSLGDSHGHAFHKGKIVAFQEAVELSRKASRTDAEGEF